MDEVKHSVFCLTDKRDGREFERARKWGQFTLQICNDVIHHVGPELTRQGEIILRQKVNFGEIRVFKKTVLVR